MVREVVGRLNVQIDRAKIEKCPPRNKKCPRFIIGVRSLSPPCPQQLLPFDVHSDPSLEHEGPHGASPWIDMVTTARGRSTWGTTIVSFPLQYHQRCHHYTLTETRSQPQKHHPSDHYFTMVNSLPLAQALNLLAALMLWSSTQVDAAIVHRRQEAPAAVEGEIAYYHYREVPDTDMPTDELKKDYYRQQALSVSSFPDADSKLWSWFFDKTSIAKSLATDKGAPGFGCQVALYFDNVKHRYDRCKENELGEAWVRPAIMAPWCNAALDDINENTYLDETLGFKTIRPNDDPQHHAIFMILR
jgi:hypothetical protein